MFSRSNTKDRASISTRIPGGDRTDIIFASSATNTPNIAIGRGSRTIIRFFVDEDPGDEDDIGIRVVGSNLSHSSGQSSVSVVTGVLNKPIGDFFAGDYNNYWSSQDSVKEILILRRLATDQFRFAFIEALSSLSHEDMRWCLACLCLPSSSSATIGKRRNANKPPLRRLGLACCGLSGVLAGNNKKDQRHYNLVAGELWPPKIAQAS